MHVSSQTLNDPPAFVRERTTSGVGVLMRGLGYAAPAGRGGLHGRRGRAARSPA
jgi:hypothetical protein